MFFKVTKERLIRAGFQLEKCEDGTFWVIEKEAGEEADRLLRVCDMALINFDAETVEDLILIQCDCDFTDPVLYIDSFLWKLTKRDFADIVSLLTKTGKPTPKVPAASDSSGPILPFLHW